VICGYGFSMQEAEEITSLLEMLDENPVELTMEQQETESERPIIKSLTFHSDETVEILNKVMTTSSQFHQRFTYEFFVRTTFSLITFGWLGTKNSYEKC